MFVWEEAVVAIEDCSLPQSSPLTEPLTEHRHLFFCLYVGVYQKWLLDLAPSTSLIRKELVSRNNSFHPKYGQTLNIPRVRYSELR